MWHVSRPTQGLTPAGRELLEDMERQGVSREVIVRCRHAMNVQVQIAARGAAPSRAALVGAMGAAFTSAALPPEETWESLLAGTHRTLQSLKEAKRACHTFASAQLACATIRGRDIGHLYSSGREEAGGKVRRLQDGVIEL